MELNEFLTEEENVRRDEFDAMMKDLYEGEEQYFAEVKRWNDRILKAIESFRGKIFTDEIKDYTEESGGGFTKFEFVRKPKGNFQVEEDFEQLKNVWVDQYRNGGFTGDDFAGDIYIPLKRGLFLRFGYNC